MKKGKTISVLFLSFLISVFGYSQDGVYTVIDKNKNDNNLDLKQELSPHLDTLLLKSDQQILRVRFLSHNLKETRTIDVVSKVVRIPLYHFEEGRYTIAVYNGPKIIVLGFNRLLPLAKPEDFDLDLEKSILRASLSASELKSKGIEPFKPSKANQLNNLEKPTTRAAGTRKPSKDKSPIELPNQNAHKNKPEEKIEYSITVKRNLDREMETREEFRERSVRPNGKKYD
ncbi:hypothetical protein ES677_03910 [Bizionia gelidisalsuginis]|uniref:Uncharacterized protein n=2 Tax=Bizionia TaxID=283785 RepID=A0A8H2LFE4_9FLAO|nr:MULTISPECIES: hypothetical protein [Bizionia]TYB74532.1 hypothetical protein ES676_07630 [Bizionia saleffrena]TYC16324.1 hypothetical protein ES677_03910 [Bizionia gelidisalsuginis]